MVHALRSTRVITGEGERALTVVIRDEHIESLLPYGEAPAGCPVEDLGELALLPGLVDVHTHINEPGRTEWEGFQTGTRAAAAGGFTTIVDMPLNSLPPTTDPAALESKRQAASGRCWVDTRFWGGAVNGNEAELLPLAQAGVAGFKAFLIYPGCDGLTEIDRTHLRLAAPLLARSGLPLLVHAELAGPIDAATYGLETSGADWRQYATYLASRPDEAEVSAVEMLLALCREYGFPLHIVHVSSAEVLGLLRAARAQGLPVTAETCPHYLHACAEEIPDGATLWKCAPPIRSRRNREQLWAALADGTLDLVATDHSPCPPAMKRLSGAHTGEGAGRFDEAWGGIASLSVALPVLWTGCRQRGYSLTQLSHWMSTAPAQLAGIAKEAGEIAPGKHASLVSFDVDAAFTVSAEELFTRHPLTPYLGAKLHGVVHSTWVRGARVFHRGHFAAEGPGREHRRQS